MSRPRLLDLFCGAGGAAMGYHRAGFDVTGVDHKLQPHFPFAFILADALEYVKDHGHEYDAIHASPPCQAYSPLTKNNGICYPKLLPATVDSLRQSRKPFVVENIMTAPFTDYVVRLCGLSFGLKLLRHRLFASNIALFAPVHIRHSRGMALRREIVTVAGGFGGTSNGQKGGHPYKRATREEAVQAMGIDWMNGREIMEAIPPAYTEWIGKQLLRVVGHADQ